MNMHSRIFVRSAIAAATGLLLMTGAAAAPAQEGFESGLGAWSSIGDVSAQLAGVTGATEGSRYALLTNASLLQNDPPAGAGSFNFSGSPAASIEAIESTLGVSVGALDPDPDNFVFAVEGAVMQRSFTVSAGDTLHFNWNFLSNESNLGASGDYAFVSLNGAIFRLADTSSNLHASSVFASETGYRGFNYTFADAGTMTVSFGVLDMTDIDKTSALAIDNVQISAVPEPGMGLLMSLGLGVLGIARMARRKRII
jgi:hypothetical protein